MSDKLKIALVCNNKMALPALQTMLQTGVLCSVASADTDKEVVEIIGQLSRQLNFSYTTIAKRERNAQLTSWLEVYKPDVVFVMTYPWKIPSDILAIPAFGFINFHYGLLPQMRGADPIFESIRQRRQTAGLTIHLMDGNFDTGAILMREEFPLHTGYTYGMLCAHMAMLGNNKCSELIAHLANARLPEAIPQDDAKAAYWPKVDRNEIAIKWDTMTSADIIALVRACNPIARGVPVVLNNWQFGVCDISEIQIEGTNEGIRPGTIIAIDPANGLVVYCVDGKAVKLEVVILGEGIFPGFKLANWGVKAGMYFF